MAYQFTTEEEIKTLSQPLIGADNDPPAVFRAVDYERFKAKFGVRPDLAVQVWNMIASKLNNHPPVKGFLHLNPMHLLYALFFLKVYPTARQATSLLGCRAGTHQFRNYASFVVRRVASLSDQVVSKQSIYPFISLL